MQPSVPWCRASSCSIRTGWLYLERAHVKRLRGRLEQPLRIFEQYRRKLADDADEIAGTVAKPPLDLELEFHKLIASI